MSVNYSYYGGYFAIHTHTHTHTHKHTYILSFSETSMIYIPLYLNKKPSFSKHFILRL